MDTLKKKVVITGAAGQLGQAIAVILEREYEVIRTDVSYSFDPERLYEYKLDVCNEKEVEEFFDRHNPDVLINNAGVSIFSSFMDRRSEELDFVYNVNLKGTINMINGFARVNQSNRGNKSVVNIASLYGVISADPRIYTDCSRNSPEIYAATKAGIIQITKYYCVHLRDLNIRVNAISPGGIFNPNDPQGDDF